jgi:hypothetical protein
MAYTALTILMLISAPSDVPDEDLATVKRTVSQWNLSMGRGSHLVVLPVSWSEHAAAEFGARPQAILNEQLVDEVDMALALFADRLGTPTGEAESGTLEEIERMVAAGKHVSILVNGGPRALTGKVAVAEKARLEEALIRLRERALVLTYSDQASLAGHLNNMLSMATGKVAATRESPTTTDLRAESLGVWPHIDAEDFQESDNRGRLKTKQRQYLVLRNETGRPVHDVSFSIPETTGLTVFGQEEVIEHMAPGAIERFQLAKALGAPRQVVCTVRWRFDAEEPRETQASIRL